MTWSYLRNELQHMMADVQRDAHTTQTKNSYYSSVATITSFSCVPPLSICCSPLQMLHHNIAATKILKPLSHQRHWRKIEAFNCLLLNFLGHSQKVPVNCLYLCHLGFCLQPLSSFFRLLEKRVPWLPLLLAIKNLGYQLPLSSFKGCCQNRGLQITLSLCWRPRNWGYQLPLSSFNAIGTTIHENFYNR